MLGATREEDLAALRARIESLRTGLEDKETDRREARDALRDSERAISDANRALQAVEAEARAARAAIADLAARRAIQEKSLETSQAAALSPVRPRRTQPVPFAPLNLPDPFEHIRYGGLRNPPEESDQPPAIPIRTPVP